MKAKSLWKGVSLVLLFFLCFLLLKVIHQEKTGKAVATESVVAVQKVQVVKSKKSPQKREVFVFNKGEGGVSLGILNFSSEGGNK